MRKQLLLLLILALAGSAGFAQVSGYVFNYSTETYTEITGGTVLATALLGGTGTNSLDEGFYIGTPIPFPFHYNGLPYTEVAVSCNGYIEVGGTTTMGYNPVSSTYVAEGNISALGRDLQGNVTDGNLGEIRYETLGDAPNRVWVVQWKNFRRYAGVNEDYNFQIRLHETTDVIDFVYGEMVVTYTGTTHPQVGLRGSANTDFVNRVVTTDWAASTPGAVNTATAVLSSTVFPASGTVYSYSVTPSTAPNQAGLVYPALNGWTFTDGVLKWSNGGGYPSNFNVYLGDAYPPPFAANVSTLYYAPTLLPNTTYYWRVDPQNGLGGTTGADWTFKTPTDIQLRESFENTVFPPAGWLNPNSWSRSTTTPYHLTAGAYKSANTTPALLITPKVTLTSTSTLDFYYRCSSSTGYGRLQIVYSPDQVTWNPVGAEISMPTVNVWNYASIDLGSAVTGDYFLAFKVYTTTSTSSIYIDHVFGPELTQEAPGPVGLVTPAAGAVDVNPITTFVWTAPTSGGVPQGYNVYCDANADPSTLVGNVTGLTYTLPAALEFTSSYNWKVVAYNTIGNSTGNEIRSFTTWADPTVTSFPWSESFDGTLFPPMGWTNVKTAGTSNPGLWDRVTSGTSPSCTPHSGAAMARYNSFSIQSGGRAELTSPPLVIPEGDGYKVHFWMYRDSGYASYNNEVINVYVNTAPNTVGGTLLGTVSRYYGFAPVEPVANAWYQYSFCFVGAAGDMFLIFEAVSQYGNNMFIDDVQITEVDPPAAPELVYPVQASVGLPQAGFDFSWSPDLVNGDPPTYYVLFIASSEATIYDEYMYDTLPGTSYNPVTDPTNPIVYSYGADYYWTVLAHNNSGEAVATPPQRFTIETLPLSAPVLAIELDTAGDVVLNWPAVPGANSYKVYACGDPYSITPPPDWTLLTSTGNLTYTYTGTGTRMFFKVYASTDMP
jgi:hypothetical protein